MRFTATETPQTLADLVAIVRSHPGVRNKAPIAMVAEVFGPTDSYAGPGDDGAVVTDGDVTMVVGGEALWPPFAQADPFGAGVAAVLANMNDLAAMGARPLAIVDTIVAPEAHARQVLEGMRYASGLYQVPIVGGHLTIGSTGMVAAAPPAISAFGLGRATSPDTVLSVRNAAPGQSLIVACCIEGSMRADFNFFRSFDERGTRLGGDVRVLAAVADEHSCVAAKDISMAGLFGSLAMLLEFRRLGVTVDLAAMPRPAPPRPAPLAGQAPAQAVTMGQWLTTFPCFGFLLCTPPGREDDCMGRFRDRGLAAAIVGALDDSGLIRLRDQEETATVFDLTTETVTGLSAAAG